LFFSGSSDDATDKSTAQSSFSATDLSLNGNGNERLLEPSSFELCQQVSLFFPFVFGSSIRHNEREVVRSKRPRREKVEQGLRGRRIGLLPIKLFLQLRILIGTDGVS